MEHALSRGLRLFAAVFCGLTVGGSIPRAGAAEPARLELEVPPGGPFARGDQVLVPVFLRMEPGRFKYVAFGLETEGKASLFFAPSAALTALPGVEFFHDRFIDSRHVAAGVGDFDFERSLAVVPVPEGRVRLGTLIVEIDRAAPERGELAVAAGSTSTTGAPELVFEGKARVPLDRVEVRLPLMEGEFVRGDPNRDGTIDISDAIHAIQAIFLDAGAEPCQDAVDANDDGRLDVTDPLYLLNFVFQGGPPPPAPYPGRGSDPTPDAVTCRE